MNYLIDTGFWIALYDARNDPNLSQEAESISELIEDEIIIIPFPTLYEFLNSRFSRSKHVFQFEKLLSRPNYEKVADTKYRNKAYDEFFQNNLKTSKDVSLVDEVIKNMIKDANLKIDYLITFDQELKNYALSNGIKTN